MSYIDEGFSKYKILNILPLDIESVKSASQEITGGNNFYKEIEKSETLKEISRKPLLLSLLVNYYDKNKELTSIKSRLDLFDYVIDQWLLRDEDSSPINSKSRLLITKHLAIKCLNYGKNSFNYSDINNAIKKQYGSLEDASLERYNNAIRNCSFIRNKDSGGFEFQHGVFLEYCIARAIIDDLILSNYNSFSWVSFSPEIVEIIYELLVRFDLKKSVADSIDIAFSKSKDSRKNCNLLKLANKIGVSNLPLDGLSLQGESLVGVDFSQRKIAGAHFENCDFAGSNLSNLTAKNWEIKGCVFKRCNLKNLQINSPKINNSILFIMPDEEVYIRFATCNKLELSVDYSGLLDFTGGELKESIIETVGYDSIQKDLIKSSSIKFSILERVLFAECAAGFYIGFCSVDELSLYSLYSLQKDMKPSLSHDIETASQKWKGGGSNVEKLISPHVRVDDKPIDPVEQYLSKTQLKKRRRRVAQRKKEGW